MTAVIHRPAGTLDVAPALRPYRGPWGRRQAAHLLRRAGFGGSPAEIDRFAQAGPREAVRALLAMPAPDADGPGDLYDPSADLFALRREARSGDLDPEARRSALRAIRRLEFRSVRALQQWWLDRMLTTSAPLQEKMTLYFHGHFTSAVGEKGITPPMIYRQNQLFRENALGNLRTLTLEVSRDPAMLLYLDNARSRKQHPNENYARELMELMTLGRGNYTEEDVRQSARAFTGWTVDYRTGTFRDAPRMHDDGVKTFLGRSGTFDGADIVRIIYEQPACAAFWARSLLGYFVYSDPEPELVDAFARIIADHDYETAPTMAVLLGSDLFYSPRAYRALVKSPVEFVVGAHKALGLDRIVPFAVPALRQMGQTLFAPPNVAGWPGGSYWIASDTMIARENFLARLVVAARERSPILAEAGSIEPHAAVARFADLFLQGDAAPGAMAEVTSLAESGLSPHQTAYLMMTMPAFHLA
jgi:uncharacterized protein (DUF1800 family)